MIDKKILVASNMCKYIRITKKYENIICIFETEKYLINELLNAYNVKIIENNQLEQLLNLINDDNYNLCKYVWLYYEAKSDLRGYEKYMDSEYIDLHYGG